MTDEAARAFWIAGPNRGEIRAAEVEAPGPADVEVETLYSAISRGTETLVFAGKVPKSEHERMRAPFQEGEFPGPVKYGYINVGRVVSGADSLLGRNVFCLYPHQTRFVVPAAAVTVVPDKVPIARAVLAASLETAVNGIWDAAPRVGDRIAVVGAGTVGCLVAWLAAGQAGTEVELIDVDPAKGVAADALGLAFRQPESATRDADLVIEASGAAAGLELALELGGFEAKIVVLSWFGAASVPLPLGAAFHSERLQLVSSQVAHIPSSQRARWHRARRMGLVMRLLKKAELDALITGESPFEELPELLPRLAAGADRVLCHRIVYR
jgi:2-desacetyl-2-hydroxyethyl bacteriochlorophyllide A dehydrogenase